MLFNPSTTQLNPTAADADADANAEQLPTVIEVRNLVKEYRLGALEGLRTLGRRMLGRTVPPRQQFRALDDVSMTIRRGEVVGIIGHNGAGKSTLLKLLCGITQPTIGTIKVDGRIAPLIEVGAGLVGDMTGRENIYLNATILGLTRAEIDRKVEEIIAFAELEKFIDTPIKRYSSGMQVRLGYAIATAVDSEFLIIDEVLAVGDLQFQRKSIERMQNLIQNTQRTVLIVGHNIRQLERLCSRMILLEKGKVLLDGKPSEVTNLFFDLATNQSKNRIKNSVAPERIESSGEVELLKIRLISGSDAVEKDEFEVGESISVEFFLKSQKTFPDFDMGVAFHTPDLMNIGISPLTASLDGKLSLRVGGNKIVCRFDSVKILPGLFYLKIGLKDNVGQMLLSADNLKPFHVIAPRTANSARYSAITFVEFGANWSVAHTDLEID